MYATTPAALPRASRCADVLVQLLGKVLLSALLIICHFLIVTILITVLTNSFAAVAANPQEGD